MIACPVLSAQIINDVMELDVHLIQGGLHMLKVFSSLLEQSVPTAEDMVRTSQTA